MVVLLSVSTPAEAVELDGGAGLGGILAGTVPHLAVSPHGDLSWARDNGFLVSIHEMISILPPTSKDGAGVYEQTSVAIWYAAATRNFSIGPSLSIYSMPACGAMLCGRVVGIAPAQRVGVQRHGPGQPEPARERLHQLQGARSIPSGVLVRVRRGGCGVWIGRCSSFQAGAGYGSAHLLQERGTELHVHLHVPERRGVHGHLLVAARSTLALYHSWWNMTASGRVAAIANAISDGINCIHHLRSLRATPSTATAEDSDAWRDTLAQCSSALEIVRTGMLDGRPLIASWQPSDAVVPAIEDVRACLATLTPGSPLPPILFDLADVAWAELTAAGTTGHE
jgi:hypothetical protein